MSQTATPHLPPNPRPQNPRPQNPPPQNPGPLSGVRVIELASAMAAATGKLLADLGADVILVEPIGGHATRHFGPFVGDQPHPDRSLHFWSYNTSKRSVEIAFDTPEGAGQFRSLIASADIVVEAESPDRLAALHLDHSDLCPAHPALIWVSVTPYGRTTPSAPRPATDLTLQAGGGPAWSCGYDDHSLPPMRGGGEQAYQVGATFAAMSALTAYLYRLESGEGQHIDVSLHAAANVTTEMSSVSWLVAGQTVQRQTGRHAFAEPTMPVQVLAGDGRYVTTGFPPAESKDFVAVLAWLDELALRDEFPETFLLEMGVERDGLDPRMLEDDPIGMEIYSASRAALCLIASRPPMISSGARRIAISNAASSMPPKRRWKTRISSRAASPPRFTTRNWPAPSPIPARPIASTAPPGPSPAARRWSANTMRKCWEEVLTPWLPPPSLHPPPPPARRRTL